MKQTIFAALTAIVLTVAVGGASIAAAATAPNLGTAATFSVLAGGSTPYEAGVATQARTDVLNVYTNLAQQACTQNLSGTIGGTTVTPGVVCISATSTFLNQISLNGQGNAGSVFVIRIPGNLTITPSSSFAFTNGTMGSNVFLRVDGSVTLTPGATFDGTIIAKGAITIDPTARVTGHAFSIDGPVSAPVGTVSCAGCVTNHPTLTINKVVINDNGGVLGPDGFTLLINDMDTLTGRLNLLAPGTYVVGELPTAGYVMTGASGACTAGGLVTLASGEAKTCTVTNNDNGSGGGVILPPNTGAGGGLADLAFWFLRSLLIAGAAAGLTFAGLRAINARKSA